MSANHMTLSTLIGLVMKTQLYVIICVRYHVSRYNTYIPGAAQFKYKLFTLGRHCTKKASCKWLSVFTSFF